MRSYTEIIHEALDKGDLLDALLLLQKRDGYLTEEAIRALAEATGDEPARLYDTASFYSMLRFEKPAPVEIRVCRGTACHSGGNGELIAALTRATGAQPGELSPDGKYFLGWVECLGQCQAAPNVLINGTLYTNVDVDKIPELLGGAK